MTRKECLKNGKVCGETLSAGSSLIPVEQNAQSRDRGVARFLLTWFKKVLEQFRFRFLCHVERSDFSMRSTVKVHLLENTGMLAGEE